MQKAALTLFFIFFLVSAQAQNNIIKFNLLSFGASTANIAFEKKISDGASFQVRGFYTDLESTWLLDDTGIKGYGVIPELRVYFSKNSPTGFYAAPFLKYQNLKLNSEDENSKANLTTFGGGLVAGVHWIFGDIFSLDLFVGPSFNFGEPDQISGSENDISAGPLYGFGVRSGFTIGFAF